LKINPIIKTKKHPNCFVGDEFTSTMPSENKNH